MRLRSVLNCFSGSPDKQSKTSHILMELYGLVCLCLSTSEEKKLSKEYPICLYIMQKPRNEPNNIYSDGYVRFVFSILLLSFYQIRSWGYAKYATVLHCKQGKKTFMSRNTCSNENSRFDSILSNQMNVHGFDDFGKLSQIFQSKISLIM